MSRYSGFSRIFCSRGSFLLPCSRGFGVPSPCHGKKDLCTVLPAGTNKAPGTHERQRPSWAFCSVCWAYHKLYLSEALGWWICCLNRRLLRFCEVCGPWGCSFGRRAAVRIAMCRQVNEVCFPDCESASPVFCKM